MGVISLKCNGSKLNTLKKTLVCLWPEYNWDVKNCSADTHVISSQVQVERILISVDTDVCWQLHVLSSFVTRFLVSPLIVANINTCESDGKHNHTAAATEQWSSASLPLTGGVFSLLSLFTIVRFPLFSALRTCSKNVTFDCYPLLFLEELCLELSRAIEAGDTQAASQHASALARQKAALTIQLSEKNYADGEIRWEMKSVEGCFKVAMTDNIFQVFAAHSAMLCVAVYL